MAEEAETPAQSVASEEETQAPPREAVHQDICGLWGCPLSRLHTGLCAVPLGSSGRERKRPRVFEGGAAEAPRKLYEAARAKGIVPPKQAARPAKPKQKRSRPEAEEVAAASAEQSAAAMTAEAGGGEEEARPPLGPSTTLNVSDAACDDVPPLTDGSSAAAAGTAGASSSADGAAASDAVGAPSALPVPKPKPKPRKPRQPQPEKPPRQHGGSRGGTRSSGAADWTFASLLDEEALLQAALAESRAAAPGESVPFRPLDRPALGTLDGDFDSATWRPTDDEADAPRTGSALAAAAAAAAADAADATTAASSAASTTLDPADAPVLDPVAVSTLGPEGLAAAAGLAATAAAGGGDGGAAAAAAAAAKLKVTRQLMQLRDFLPKGRDDRAANQMMESEESVKLDKRNAQLGRGSWGCVCQGHKRSGAAIACADCGKWFHAACERLDYSAAELEALSSKRKFVCKACEEVRLQEAGFDMTKGRFEWQCRFCSRTFADEAEATTHGKKCAGAEIRRKWSCPCNGELGSKGGKAGSNANITQCERCQCWFHKSCKRRARAAWEDTPTVDTMCLRCEKGEAIRDGASGPSGRASALGSDQSDEHAAVDAAAARARRRKLTTAQQDQALAELLPVGKDEVGGTLENGRVFVTESKLGSFAGFGLFAGQNFETGDVITSYEGPILYRSEVEEEQQKDTSYVLRIPNSGGALIDGKPIGDAIRNNPSNPGAWGRYYPKEGAPEWTQGAASMANDPRDTRLYNSNLKFVKRQGANKALAELAPMRAILFATRGIKIGEEIYYNYGSDKPFEKMRKEMHRKQVELQRKEREVCRSVWVPFAEGEAPAAE